MKPAWRALAAALTGAAALCGGAAAADDAAAGRAHYLETCMRCHGLLKADTDSWTPHNLVNPAIASPQGPALSDIYGRPAGIVETYGYSRSFREAAENPWTWDADSLDSWIADSQAFIRGTTMFVKIPDESARAAIIAYLRRFAPWTRE